MNILRAIQVNTPANETFNTSMKTIKTIDGQNITFHKEHLHKYFHTTMLENILKLNEEEQSRWFNMMYQHKALWHKIHDTAIRKSESSEVYGKNTTYNPEEEYLDMLEKGFDEDLSNYQNEIRLQHARLYSEWYITNIK